MIRGFRCKYDFDKYCESDKCDKCVKHPMYQQGRADAIEEFDRICEEARGHKFGVCDADFVIDVIKAKVKEQLKEQTNDD